MRQGRRPSPVDSSPLPADIREVLVERLATMFVQEYQAAQQLGVGTVVEGSPFNRIAEPGRSKSSTPDHGLKREEAECPAEPR